MEYGSLAKYYDMFYQNKNYEKEKEFLLTILEKRKRVLDAGCGTGEHLKLLQNSGYIVDGFDLSNDMLEIAKTKTANDLYVGDVKTFNNSKKYDAIISMFAVFNHLKDYNEFEISIINLMKSLKKNGVLIIDLHNGRKNGEKRDTIGNMTRIMSWNYNDIDMTEYTNIKYIINNQEFNDNHTFLIYDIDKIKEIMNRNYLKYDLYENYTLSKASNNSKNIQIIVYN